jgi:hypothetical protein
VTVPAGGDAAALATIAAQATRIAELEGGNPPTPTPATPTTVPGTVTLPQSKEPQLTLHVAPTEVEVGEEVTVSAQSSGVGIPIFSVWVRDVGTEDFTEIVRIDDDGGVQPRVAGTQVLELMMALGEPSGLEESIVVVFEAIAPGRAEVKVDASGEVMRGGAYVWGGAAADPILITVVEAGGATPTTPTP